MNPMQSMFPAPRDVLRLLAAHRWRWLAPAVLVAALAMAYALLVPPTWQASQALIIRNEAANSDTGLGKFTRTEDLKNIQETILELAKSRGVLLAALNEVGPAARCANEDAWPTERDIDLLRQAVKVAPPKGVEFGTAEMFYVDVRDHDRVRAVRLNQAICGQLQTRFQEIRDAKAQSMIDELNKAAHLAKAGLDEATGRLAATEKQVGSDLAELRALQDANSGEGTVRRTVSEIENELRQARAGVEANRQLLDLLRASKDDPGRLLATPNRLLDSQPGLRRLKEGLVDAQLRTATLQGRMSDAHPSVRSAKEAEEQVGRELHKELAIAIRGVEAEVQLSTIRTATLEGQLAQTRQRLTRLAELRAPYANQAAATMHRTKLVERAEQNLAEAHAALASAKAASLISRIDSPDTGVRPVTASRAAVILAGLVGGLLAGLGVLLLTVRAGAPTVETSAAAPALADDAVVTPAPARRSPSSAEVVFDRKGNLSLRRALERIGGRNGA
jgi:polysaccharide biosynthesis transport protein